jgi:hypothetical protein
MAMMLNRPGGPHGAVSLLPGIIIGGIGLLTIDGCVSRLLKQR